MRKSFIHLFLVSLLISPLTVRAEISLKEEVQIFFEEHQELLSRVCSEIADKAKSGLSESLKWRKTIAVGLLAALSSAGMILSGGN